jgi:hypothetical protein
MAEETVDRAVEPVELTTTSPCRTKEVQLIGSDGWVKNLCIGSIQRVSIIVHKAVVDIVNRTQSRRTSPTTTTIVRGPSASIWSRQVNDGRCMVSG